MTRRSLFHRLAAAAAGTVLARTPFVGPAVAGEFEPASWRQTYWVQGRRSYQARWRRQGACYLLDWWRCVAPRSDFRPLDFVPTPSAKDLERSSPVPPRGWLDWGDVPDDAVPYGESFYWGLEIPA